MIDEYVQGQPMFQQPVMYQQPMYVQGQQPMSPNQYQGNVGTEGLAQQMQNFGPQNYQGMVNPMNPFNN